MEEACACVEPCETAFDEICGTLEFLGKPFELQAIMNRDMPGGRWDRSKRGTSYRYTHQQKGLILYWSLQSYDVLLRWVPRPADIEEAPMCWPPTRAWTREHRFGRWDAYEVPEHGLMTLPEMVFECPVYFFGEVMSWQNDTDFAGSKRAELLEITDKVAAIRIPNTAKQGMQIVHSFDSDHYYNGFELQPANRPIRIRSGVLCEEPYIDLRKPRPNFADVAVGSLGRLISSTSTLAWPRDRCEAFFDDEHNFISQREHYELNACCSHYMS